MTDKGKEKLDTKKQNYKMFFSNLNQSEMLKGVSTWEFNSFNTRIKNVPLTVMLTSQDDTKDWIKLIKK